MQETIFVIKELGFGWYRQNIANEDDAQIYCAEELQVLQEWIEKFECFDNRFKLSLHRFISNFVMTGT
ncbi:hypothetical protein [Sulfurimonas sp. HSL3-7]|uniref:hypothetical protein n=1 Tax=Sulfonitrofixus jiaomeiensis TaxID=3131938 RepID=UPI0031F89F0F